MNRFLQALIALSGLAITGLLGWQSVETDRRQERVAWISIIINQVNAVSSGCGTTPAEIAGAAIASLPKQEQDRYNEMLQKALDGCSKNQAQPGQANAVLAAPSMPGAPIPLPTLPSETQQQQQWQQQQSLMQQTLGETTSIQNLELKVGESKAPLGLKWRAVLASYRTFETKIAAEHYMEVKDSIAADPSIKFEIYYTPGSGHLVLALTRNTESRDEARALTAQAASMKWSEDAFVQSDRAWKQCTPPGSGQSLEAALEACSQ